MSDRNNIRIYVTGIGIATSLGNDPSRVISSLLAGNNGIAKLKLFAPDSGESLPVGEITERFTGSTVTRTHDLALFAAKGAVASSSAQPGAIVIGTTTGGMPTTELMIKKGSSDPNDYVLHGAGSIAAVLASTTGCSGPCLTVSTACSSGAASIIIAMEILLRGIARTALAGGVDSLCRLTYFGFDSLKLIDPNGPGPFDRDRAGMCVSEGCGMLLLAAAEEPPSDTIAELRGGGLSCDAYHPAAPHPDGEGALAAMRAALENAGLTARDISYVNCHGTGTRDNDLSEARAMKALFGENIPPFSSQKGSFGHTLAASGAIEAAVSALSIRDGFIPPNAGFKKIDPDIGLCPQSIAFETRVDSVMSNSFGFGGNNASVILAKPGMFDEIIDRPNQIFFIVRGCSLYTAAGGSEETLRALADTGSCAGTAIMPDSPGGLQPREVRRLKRLSRLALSLAHDAAFIAPASVFMGTAWGALSETSDFLDKLYESGERYSSPTDFMGSVHNSPAGNVAIRLGAKGPNITVTDGDSSFEHALFAASILSNGDALIIGADEYHEKLSPLFDPVLSKAPCDGGGALFLGPCKEENGVRISPVFFGFPSGPEVVEALIESLLKASLDASKFGAVLAGSAHSRNQDGLWKGFLSSYRPDCPVIYYHDFIGRHSSASAVAAALSCMFVKSGSISIKSQNPEFIDLAGRGVLLLNFGDRVTAVAVMP